MTVEAKAGFSGDHPIGKKDEDRLNRGAFADRIARVLLGLPRGASLTIGIHGPWGDGKTTILNLIRAELVASPDAITMDFNPWRFADEASMLRGFFHDIAKVIGTTLATKGEEVAKWCESWARRASFLDERIGSAADLLAAKTDVGLEELRSRLSEVLMESGKRIVILVDDIDRLDKHEVHTLFRLVKACADFPNLSYVLAFDDLVVAEALGERYGSADTMAGRAFLEKIIQVPLKVPVAAKEDLRALCFEHVDAALTSAGMTLSQDQATEFVASFDRCVLPRLTTPRAAKRYANGLMFAAPMLRGESDPIDMLLVEALRAFFPEVYDVVRQNQESFSGDDDHRSSRADGPPRAERLLKPVWHAMTPEDAAAGQELLTELFPRLGNVFQRGNLLRGTRTQAERRISSPQYCSRYFTYAVARNDVADTEILAIGTAAASGDQAAVSTSLECVLLGPKIRRVIEKLRGMATTLNAAAADTLALSLAKLGTKLPERLAPFSFAEPHAQAAMLVAQLLRQTADRGARLTTAKEIAATAEPLRFGAECVRWMYTSDDPNKEDKNTLTRADVNQVAQIVAERIKKSAAEGCELFDPNMQGGSELLYLWRQAEGRAPVQAYLEARFEKDPSLILRFLEASAPIGWSDRSAPKRIAEMRPVQLRNMDLVIDLDTLAALIRKHCAGNFDAEHMTNDAGAPVGQRLVEQFMFIYRKWKSEGTWGEPNDDS
jgi:hypothetical protein